ncbi:MAG: zinc ABC transporter substrate-binding protein [Oscillospiraceae bacterium]|nr:zinc ABC transporter substrate-binding protein [Oscillospiraceae bacterium]
MKKIIAAALIIVTVLGLASCGSVPEKADDGTLKIISTIFPPFDFARQIAGSRAEVTMLLPPGAESHSYEPSPQDIIAIQNCDLFIYVGGESDAWIEDVLGSMGDKAPKTLTLFECVELVEEEIVDGMQANKAPSDEKELDEHVWTSPKNAILIAEALSDTLSGIDPDGRDTYSENAAEYTEQLRALDALFEDAVSSGVRRTIIVGDRFPFRYLADAYKLEYYAAFPGCSADSEPSAATVAFLIDKVRAENIPAVFYIEFSTHKIADAMAEATGAKTLLLHSCHNITNEELENGATYVSIMTENAQRLKEALS